MKTTLELSIELTNLQTIRQAKERKLFLELMNNGHNSELYNAIDDNQVADGLRRDK